MLECSGREPWLFISSTWKSADIGEGAEIMVFLLFLQK
jgi:hypothetical protein